MFSPLKNILITKPVFLKWHITIHMPPPPPRKLKATTKLTLTSHEQINTLYNAVWILHNWLDFILTKCAELLATSVNISSNYF